MLVINNTKIPVTNPKISKNGNNIINVEISGNVNDVIKIKGLNPKKMQAVMKKMFVKFRTP